jgi:drug/metabolite transporter (DMT)-like permease
MSASPATFSSSTSFPTAQPRVLFALVALWILWGSTFLGMRIAVETLPPLTMAGTRFVVAGAIVLALARARGQALPTRSEWLISAPLGALMFLVGNGFVVIAERTLPSSLAATACATTPLVATAIAAVRGERPRPRDLFGMLLGLVGVVFLAGGSLSGGSLGPGVLLLVAPLGWALASMIARAKGVTSFACAGAQMLGGGVTMLAIGLLLRERMPDHVSLRSAIAWVYLIVFGSVVGFSSYVYLLRHARPAVALSYAYVNPVLAVALGAWIGGERIGWTTLAATSLIAVGVATSVLGRPAVRAER